MPNDPILWQRVDELKTAQANTDKELAVLIQRTDALSLRTDRIMQELAQARAEAHKDMTAISSTMSEIRTWQDRHDGREEGRGWAEDLKRWALPLLISCLGLAAMLDWI